MPAVIRPSAARSTTPRPRLMPLALGAFFACAVPALAGDPPIESVVEPQALSLDRSEDRSEDLVILDVRTAEDYDQGHVRGAIRVDLKDWKTASHAAATGLDHEDYWRRRIGALGIDGNDAVILYDAGNMTDAARIWFILQHFGVARAGVVNGGYPAMQAAIASGRIPTTREPTVPESADFDPRGRADSTVGARSSSITVGVIGKEKLKQDIDRGRGQVLDVRTVEEYVGERRHDNPRGGHLPGAINLPHKQLLDEDGRLKSPEELAKLFEQAGVRRDRPLVVHCESGGRSSLAALAAARAGYGPVLNYYLSFGEWSADATCPVVTPENKNLAR